MSGATTTYYDRPVIKEPVWIWSVPAYFFVGGAAGGAAVVAAAATLGGRELDDLARRASWLSVAGATLGTGFLILDLGRPARFLNMLRVFRPSSPMSVGSWVLALAAPCFGAGALLSRRGGPLGRLGLVATCAGGILGLPLSGYTAVLVSTSAVPVWQATSRSLPYLFVASAASSAAGLLGMADLEAREEKVVTRFGFVAQVAEMAAAKRVERDAGRVERVGRPFHTGVSGSLWKASTVLSACSLAVTALPGSSRARRIVAGLLGSASGLCLRFSVFQAGKTSARDPLATFEQQRDSSGKRP